MFCIGQEIAASREWLRAPKLDGKKSYGSNIPNQYVEQIRENNHLLPNGQLSLGSLHCQQEEKDFTRRFTASKSSSPSSWWKPFLFTDNRGGVWG